jgi:hypothetical protein
MSENMKHNERCEVCGSGYGRCGMCGNVCGVGGYGIIRWILGILIIAWVFSIGMKMGELKGYLESSGYGYGHKQYMKGAIRNPGTFYVTNGSSQTSQNLQTGQ